jgi:tyrosine-protein kinase Src
MGNCIKASDKASGDIAINGKVSANYRSKDDKGLSESNPRTPLSNLPIQTNAKPSAHGLGTNESSVNRTPSASHSKIVIALYTYNAKDDGDLSFKKGERLHIIDDTDPDWWLAKHMNNNQKGYIPMNYVASEAIEMEESVIF